jgi:hypothetical protein
MERKKVVKEVKADTNTIIETSAPGPIKIWWINKGGSFTLNNHWIKEGQRFKASEEEISTAFRDVIVRVDPPTGEMATPVKPVRTSYKQVPNTEQEGFFDIISNTGKRLNETPLDEKTAQTFIHDLDE